MSNWKYILMAGVIVLGVGAELLKTDGSKEAAKKINNTGVLAKNIGFDMGYDQDIVADPQEEIVIRENAVGKRLRAKAKNFKFKKKNRKGWTPDAARLSKADFKHGKKVKSKDKKKKKRKKIAKKKKRVKRKTAKREKKSEQKPVASALPPKQESPPETPSSNDNLGPASAVAANNSDNDKKKGLADRSIEDWFAAVSEPRPSRKKVDDLIQHFQTGVVSETVFYGVAKKMQDNTNVSLQELSVRMFGAKATSQGYIGLARFSTSSDFGVSTITEAEKYLGQFQTLQNVGILTQVINSSTTDAIKVRAVKDASSSADRFLGSGEVPTTKENGRFTNPNAQAYSDLLRRLTDLQFFVQDSELQNEIAILISNLTRLGVSNKA